ncbi:response regulator [Thauera sinica]|uniref:Response regulatory domain-containing protein n=1 Tax=Thauera sinica TaxID=2665146 RepID=A0ABW1AUM8_9RHOO|nr:response regulator [Thauera sp. K11]ATE61961.1 hypothetical protein CCZ27_20085 [Thauera sp. K11]
MSSTDILILDDEPHLLDWLVEYIEAKNYRATFAVNVAEAMKALNSQVAFRMMILDLNVPAPGEYFSLLKSRGHTYESFRGLYVAEQARNMGYRGRQVIVYSVHDIEEVRLVTDRLGATYITKGRPRAFKAEIDHVLSFDPSTHNA